MAYLINETQKLDNLITLAERACLLFGNSDNPLWRDLGKAALQVRLMTLPKEALKDISGALGIPEYVD
jgi:hypothetical protein